MAHLGRLCLKHGYFTAAISGRAPRKNKDTPKSPLHYFVLLHNTPHTLDSIRKLTLLHTNLLSS
jgi:hypothetical protein